MALFCPTAVEIWDDPESSISPEVSNGCSKLLYDQRVKLPVQYQVRISTSTVNQLAKKGQVPVGSEICRRGLFVPEDVLMVRGFWYVELCGRMLEE